MQLIPHPNSKFLKVKCNECETETIVFNHAKSVVKCSNTDCGHVIASPMGGKAEIDGEIVEVLE